MRQPDNLPAFCRAAGTVALSASCMSGRLASRLATQIALFGHNPDDRAGG